MEREVSIAGTKFEVEAWDLFKLQARAIENNARYYYGRDRMDAKKIEDTAGTIISYKDNDSRTEAFNNIADAIKAMAHRIIELEEENEKLKAGDKAKLEEELRKEKKKNSDLKEKLQKLELENDWRCAM